MVSRAALQAIEINHRYEQGFLWARSLSFTWDAPKAIAVTGPNGAGKSTLLALVGGLLRPTKGEVHFSWDGKALAPAIWRQQVSWLSPHLSPPPELTLYDLLQSYARFKGFALSPDFLDEIQLKDRRDAPLSHLSFGQRQRLLLALTLARQSSILILDEPTAFLDQRWKSFFHERIKERIQQDKTLVVCATNDPSEATLFPENLYLGSHAA